MKKYAIQKSLINLTTLISFVIICPSYSCSSTKNPAENKQTVENTPKIIFLNYSIKHENNGHVLVKLINTIKTDGKLKKTINAYNQEGIPGDLKCNQLNKKQKPLQSVLIKNPLSKDFEYVDDFKEFKIAHVELDSTEFSVRLQLLPDTKYVSITNYQQKPSDKPLILTQVN
ncbi:hypothetical protein [uncultured Algibacter sp.]|uniref:hypothetical protein n=1 Tax=uncultured Algibacter sp. TaxID=298659 RepID=UPI002624D544|nr:hypothetical protein [uncultured Algibacter sp.]